MSISILRKQTRELISHNLNHTHRTETPLTSGTLTGVEFPLSPLSPTVNDTTMDCSALVKAAPRMFPSNFRVLLAGAPLVLFGLWWTAPTLQPLLLSSMDKLSRHDLLVANPSNVTAHALPASNTNTTEELVSTCRDTPKVLEAMMSKGEQRLLSSYITPTAQYFEWGSGGSTDTYGRLTTGTVVSIENFKDWCDKVGALPFVKCRQKTLHKLHYKCINPYPTVPFGFPKDEKHYGDFDEYINAIEEYPDFDVVLVDGRWRVACAMRALDYIRDDTVVFLHDVGKLRPYYDVVYKWYDVIERAESLIAMRRKTNTPRPTKEEFMKYQNMPKW